MINENENQEKKTNEELVELNNNDTLLISEISNVVLLPYTAKEVQKILNSENSPYKTADEVIADKFTRKLSDYKNQFLSRYHETMKLLTEREKYSKFDSMTLALEIMRKKYLYPAIISACRTLEDLDVYLDCLEKNEVDDFKIFKIKYELYPTVIKGEKSNVFINILNQFKNMFGVKKGKHSEVPFSK